MILTLQMFWTACFHLGSIITFFKLIPHYHNSCLSCQVKGLCCFFGCHGNNLFRLFWLLLKNNIIPENVKCPCSWFSEFLREGTSTQFKWYCSCDFLCRSLISIQKVTAMVSSITLKWNIFRTIRGIYKWSMATIFQLILIATQEYYYPRKCEVAMLVILCILEGQRTYTRFWYFSCDFLWSLICIQKVTAMVSSITLKWNISRTIRGICKWSMVFVSFSLAVSSQINLLFGWTFLLTIACQSFCLQSHPSSARI